MNPPQRQQCTKAEPAILKVNSACPLFRFVLNIYTFTSVSMITKNGWPDRVVQIREEIMWSWNAYKKFAWGYDELMPISRAGMYSGLLGNTRG